MKKVDILLIEDSRDDAELTINALNKCEQVEAVMHLESGEEAIDFLFRPETFTSEQHLVPRLILLDLKMPRIDGIELLRRIKWHDKTKVIPTVVLTSSREDQDILQSYELGANSYLVKPVDYHGFLEMISNVVQYWLGQNQPPFKF